MDICRAGNKYFNDKSPWTTRKSAPEICATTLNICFHIVNLLSGIMAPFMPDAARKLCKMINLKPALWDELSSQSLSANHLIAKPEILFAKIDDDVIEREIKKLNRIGSDVDPESMHEEKIIVDFDQFKQINLKTATVLKADTVKGTDKLLKLQIDLGNETRQIIAGIAQYYTPEEMTGKTVIIVANLKSTRIRGIESQGMLLAVHTGHGLKLLTTDGQAPPGMKIS